MPIGGLPEKLMAAQRAGITKVLIPADNADDLDDVAEEVKQKLEIIPVRTVEEVLGTSSGKRNLRAKTVKALMNAYLLPPRATGAVKRKLSLTCRGRSSTENGSSVELRPLLCPKHVFMIFPLHQEPGPIPRKCPAAS